MQRDHADSYRVQAWHELLVSMRCNPPFARDHFMELAWRSKQYSAPKSGALWCNAMRGANASAHMTRRFRGSHVLTTWFVSFAVKVLAPSGSRNNHPNRTAVDSSQQQQDRAMKRRCTPGWALAQVQSPRTSAEECTAYP